MSPFNNCTAKEKLGKQLSSREAPKARRAFGHRIIQRCLIIRYKENKNLFSLASRLAQLKGEQLFNPIAI